MAMQDSCLRPPCPDAAGACKGFSMHETACIYPAKHGTANGGAAVGTPGNERCGTGTGTGGAAATPEGIFRLAASSRGPSLRLYGGGPRQGARGVEARRLGWTHPAQGPRAGQPRCKNDGMSCLAMRKRLLDMHEDKRERIKHGGKQYVGKAITTHPT